MLRLNNLIASFLLEEQLSHMREMYVALQQPLVPPWWAARSIVLFQSASLFAHGKPSRKQGTCSQHTKNGLKGETNKKKTKKKKTNNKMATKYIEEDKRDSIIPWLSGAQQNSFISSTPDNRSLFGLLIRGTHEGRSSSFVHHHTAGNLLFPPKTIPSCIIHYYIQTGTRLPRHLLSYYYLGNWLALLGLKSPKEPAARRKKKRLDCLAQFPLDIWYSSSVLSSCFLSLSSSTGRQFSTIKGKVPEALFSPFFFWCPPFLTDCVLLAWDWLTDCMSGDRLHMNSGSGCFGRARIIISSVWLIPFMYICRLW